MPCASRFVEPSCCPVSLRSWRLVPAASRRIPRSSLRAAPAALPANVPPGSTLESSTTVVGPDGQVVNRHVYRAPNQLITNGPQCTKGDPQCP